MCKEQGRVTAATVCDHIDKHSKLTIEGFFAGPFQSLCKAHHDSAKQSEERTGIVKPTVGVDGWPVTDNAAHAGGISNNKPNHLADRRGRKSFEKPN
jgi:hypothetical protein